MTDLLRGCSDRLFGRLLLLRTYRQRNGERHRQRRRKEKLSEFEHVESSHSPCCEHTCKSDSASRRSQSESVDPSTFGASGAAPHTELGLSDLRCAYACKFIVQGACLALRQSWPIDVFREQCRPAPLPTSPHPVARSNNACNTNRRLSSIEPTGPSCAASCVIR